MKVAIIEDELPAMMRMKDLVAACPHPLELVGEANTGQKAIDFIELNRPDAIFLDIQLPDINGFEMLINLTHNPYVIFTTAYSEYALKAFEHFAIDYLVKPIEQERFNQAVQKLLDMQTKTASDTYNKMQDLMAMMQPKEDQTLPIKEKDRIVLINFEDILYFQSEDKYINVVLHNGKTHLLTKSLSQLELELPANFHRVHRSFIVNMKFVVELEKYFNGRYILKLRDKKATTIKTGEMYRRKIKDVFGL